MSSVPSLPLLVFHRDLHWGNILVKTTKQKECSYLLNGQTHSIVTRGVQVNIIDYSLSRMEIGRPLACLSWLFVLFGL